MLYPCSLAYQFLESNNGGSHLFVHKGKWPSHILESILLTKLLICLFFFEIGFLWEVMKFFCVLQPALSGIQGPADFALPHWRSLLWQYMISCIFYLIFEFMYFFHFFCATKTETKTKPDSMKGLNWIDNSRKKGSTMHNAPLVVNNPSAWLKTITSIISTVGCLVFGSSVLWLLVSAWLRLLIRPHCQREKCFQTPYNCMAETKKSRASEWSGMWIEGKPI